MEIHQLRYFVAVAQTRNFSRAAERCHVAQPSLSQQIMKLEDELGEKLFERSRRHVSLTPAGELFVPHAERVLGELAAARDRVRDLRGEVRGEVTVGALPTIAPYLLPEALAALEEKHPGIRVTVHEDTTQNLVRLAREREIDLAIVSLPVEARGIESTPLFDEELLVALPTAHPLARRRTLGLDELREESFILMQESHCLSGQSLQFCRTGGLAPRVTFRSAQMETMQAFVAAGRGVSLVPAMARVRGDYPGVAYRRVRRPGPARTIGVIARSGRAASRATQALQALLLRPRAPDTAGA